MKLLEEVFTISQAPAGYLVCGLPPGTNRSPSLSEQTNLIAGLLAATRKQETNSTSELQRKVFPTVLKKRLVESLIFPIFDYCDVVYCGGISAELERSLQVAQNACVRYVFNLTRYDHVSHYYNDLNWMDLKSRGNLHMLLFLFKIINLQCPNYIFESIEFLSDINQYSTRSISTKILKLPLHRTAAGEQSFHVTVSRLWNALPVSARNSTTFGSFKSMAVDYIKSMSGI
ncbi:hypothetical protein M8J77_025257 [Diaphorina citri]|nr:hypothetical protein M8J77_025257 [Diaphorina citri]